MCVCVCVSCTCVRRRVRARMSPCLCLALFPESSGVLQSRLMDVYGVYGLSRRVLQKHGPIWGGGNTIRMCTSHSSPSHLHNNSLPVTLALDSLPYSQRLSLSLFLYLPLSPSTTLSCAPPVPLSFCTHSICTQTKNTHVWENHNLFGFSSFLPNKVEMNYAFNPMTKACCHWLHG